MMSALVPCGGSLITPSPSREVIAHSAASGSDEDETSCSLLSAGTSCGPNEASETGSPPPRRQGSFNRQSARHWNAGHDVVFTPWLPRGVSHHTVKLAEEMRAFARFMQLTQREKDLRGRLRATVQEAVAAASPCATVKIYGSFAYGLSMPQSAVDLVCDHFDDVDAVEPLADELRCRGVTVVSAQRTPDGASLRLESSGVAANLIILPQASSARRTVALVQQWLAQYPVAVPVSFLVRAVLSQVRMDSPATGGLSAYAVLAMIVHVCKRVDDPQAEPDTVLFAFLHRFSQVFDFANFVISSESAECRGRVPQEMGEPVIVEDPFQPGNNLAAGCVKLPAIRAHFQYCLQALAKWDSNAGTRRGYKGRTPLSSVVSHQCITRQRGTAARVE